MKVCVADVKELDDALLGRFMAGMPDERRARTARFRRRSDKALAAGAHRLLLYMLKTEYGIAPAKAQWAAYEYGKPYLQDADVQFNISHSGDMVMCAVCDGPVGVDIERIRPYSSRIPVRIMSPEEKKAYDAAADKETMFFAVWTLKEAYIKYTGRGFMTPLGALTAYPDGGTVRTNTESCCLKSFDSIGGYMAAVCADTPYEGALEHIDITALAAF